MLVCPHFRMLEGAVARLLNHLLGKYVVDLDTENLNVGIFSGHVQLTDLKLKTEALVSIRFSFSGYFQFVLVRVRSSNRSKSWHNRKNLAANTMDVPMESTRSRKYRRFTHRFRSFINKRNVRC